MDLVGELHARSPLFVTREQFERGLAGASIEPVEEGGRVIGCFVIRGADLHFAKFDSSAVTRRHLTRLRELITLYGFAQTRTPKDDPRQRAFNERLGFVVTGEDEHDWHMRIERFRRT